MKQRHLLAAGLIALTAHIASCVRTVYVEQYVVRDPDPSSAQVAVVPSTASVADFAAVDVITGYIISAGCRVVERPSLVREQQNLDGTSSSVLAAWSKLNSELVTRGSSAVSRLTTSGDPVDAIKSSNAEYVCFVRDVGHAYWLRLVKRNTEQVLYSGLYTPRTPDSMATSKKVPDAVQRMRNLLASAGVLR